MKVQRETIAAFGVASLVCMTWMAPFVSNVHESFFTLPGSIAAVTIPVLIALCLTWLLWAALLKLAAHSPRLSPWIWTFLAVLLLREIAEIIYTLRPTHDAFKWPGPPPTSFNIAFVIGAFILVAVILALRKLSPATARRTKWLATSALIFVAFSGAFTAAEICLHTYQARDLNSNHPLHQSNGPITTKPRVIWIVLDELSYRQLYEHRYPGLNLPSFDRLASEATVFTNARPEGTLTLHVIPALLSGVANSDVSMPIANVPYKVKNAATGKWQNFDPQQTVFADALHAGYQTAVSGWTFPYCRLLASVLDHCYWATAGMVGPGLSTSHTIAQNLRGLFLASIWNRAAQLRLIRRPPMPLEDSLPEEYQHLVATQAQDIADPSIDFLYFHMNLPHPHGFYDRATGAFDTQATHTYIDNLALADRYLAETRAHLEAAGTWDNSTVIIMGDHSWRTYGWKTDSGWTHEESLASSGGVFDDRPGYIVKLANQHTAETIAAPFQAVRSRALVDQILAGKITTPQELKTWVGQ